MIVEKQVDQLQKTDMATDNYRRSGESAHTTIKAMHSELRPREKALAHGCENLTLPELWALIIGSGTRGCNVIDVCTDLMQRNDFNLTMLARRTLKQIASVKGLGPNKALQIMATIELARRFQQQQLPERPPITCSNDAYQIIRPEIAHLGHEEMWIMLLNRANKVIKIFRASRGTTTATLFDLKGILKEALLEQAEGLILTHNHPSGNCNPSGPDDKITAQCKEACNTLDLRLFDHIIATTEGYYSYCDQGRL